MPNTAVIRLDECHQNQTCQIASLDGDLATKLHLVNLGFHTNSHVKVALIRGENFVLCVDGSRFAIDKNIAHTIKVYPLS